MATNTAQRRRTRARKRPWVRRIKVALSLGFLVALVGATVLGVILSVKLRDAQGRLGSLPDVMADAIRNPSVVVSADGKVLYSVSSEYRQPVKFDEIPKLVVDATLAAEDRRFFEHPGVDYWALGRSFVANVREGRNAQGGSTITMQLVKRVYTSSNKSLSRKLDDVALAIVLERQLNKNQILEMYLNQVYYGSGAYGIKAAADIYFDKPLDKLTPGEAAMLARCVRRPSDENPYHSLKRALENRNLVLRTMADEGMIDARQFEAALKEIPNLRPPESRARTGGRLNRAPYFVMALIDELKRLVPDMDLSRGGFRIETTLNSELQTVAEEQVRELVGRDRSRKGTNAALVLKDREGRSVVMVGGVDFDRDQFNAVTQGRRQPGSSFKPFVYATALAAGVIGPNDSISNERFTQVDPTTGETWSPKNSGGHYGGSVSVRSAIVHSINVAAVRVMEKVGPEAVVASAKSVFGFKSSLPPYLSLALGSGEVSPLEMAEAYSVFMLRGDRATPFMIRRVMGPDGEILKDFAPNVRRSVLSSEVATEMDGFLRGVVTDGTARKARSIPNARGKTGTTSDNKDAWFCGYTDEYVGIGWVAHPVRAGNRWNYEPMASSVFGGKVTVDAWVGVFQKVEAMLRKGTLRRRVDGKTTFEKEAAPPIEASPPDAPLDEVPPPEEGDPHKPVTVPEIGGGASGGTGGGDGEVKTDGGTRPATPPTTKPEPPPAKRAEPVSVDVCVDSGLRATRYCPETITRKFVKGKEPKRVCNLHGTRR